jgi:hypothetical protein
MEGVKRGRSIAGFLLADAYRTIFCSIRNASTGLRRATRIAGTPPAPDQRPHGIEP